MATSDVTKRCSWSKVRSDSGDAVSGTSNTAAAPTTLSEASQIAGGQSRKMKLVVSGERRKHGATSSPRTLTCCTTQVDVDVTDERKNDGIAALERTRHPLAE